MQFGGSIPRVATVLLTVNTQDARTVERRVIADHQHLFPSRDARHFTEHFEWGEACFLGRNPEFLPIDAAYHDLEHTLQGTLVLSELLRRRADAGATPAIEAEPYELAILAILIHDSGYLKHRGDTAGTGAKYTFTHVQRSCDFAADQLPAKGYTATQIRGIQNMIRCTGLGTSPAGIPFQSEVERVCGFALGTADLVGQMAATDYPDQLPILFTEFKEAAEFSGGSLPSMPFKTPRELMANTHGFWRNYVIPKLETEFCGLHRFLGEPGGGSAANPYFQAIEANLERLTLLLKSGA